jgi:hypothetical protein
MDQDRAMVFDVRPAAEIPEIPVLVEADVVARRSRVAELELVGLTPLADQAHHGRGGPQFTCQLEAAR